MNTKKLQFSIPRAILVFLCVFFFLILCANVRTALAAVEYGAAESGVEYDSATNTLTLTNANVPKIASDYSNAIHATDTDLTIVLNGDNILTGAVACSGKLTITGPGTLLAVGLGNDDLGANAMVAGGAIVIEDATVTLSRAETALWCKGLTISGGALNISSSQNGITVEGGIALNNGASLSVASPKYRGIYASGAINVAGGAITVSGQASKSANSIDSKSSVTMTSGSIKVSSSTGAAIYCKTLKVTGGALSLGCVRKSQNAIYARSSASVAPRCLRSLYGKIPAGVYFAKSGNTYKTTGAFEASLIEYGSSTKAASIGNVSYGGNSYDIETIAANAFDTTAGHAITSVVFKDPIKSIGQKAFYGCKKVKTITFKAGISGAKIGAYAFYKTTALTKIDFGWIPYKNATTFKSRVNKKAFSSCGKGKKGKSLTVRARLYYRSSNDELSTTATKKALKTRGLPSKAKVKM